MDEPAAEKRCNGTGRGHGRGRGRRSGHRGIRSPTQKSCDLARKGKKKKQKRWLASNPGHHRLNSSEGLSRSRVE